MRTAIYVYQPSTVTIRATDPLDASVEICRYNTEEPRRAIDKHALAAGIYAIESIGPLEITGEHIAVEVSGRGKDKWPEPSPNVLALEHGSSTTSIQEFFAFDKDVSPDEPGTGAIASDDVMIDD